MFVSGFTFVRNAIKYDYPVLESILSLLPLVDELVVCLGYSEDGTASLIENIGNPKIKIVHSVWDETLREGGKVLAVETDKALDAVATKADWCIYLQADEIIHEEDYPAIRQAMLQHKNNLSVEGILFDYIHFYGSYDFVGDSRRWYRHEIRIIRPGMGIRSYRDAQGFRRNNQLLRVKKCHARIFHYGWVKDPLHQQEKQKTFNKLWHSDEKVRQMVKESLYDYSAIDSLAVYKGTHPAVMQERIRKMDWDFSYEPSQRKVSIKNSILHWIESSTGKRLFEYRNYRVI